MSRSSVYNTAAAVKVVGDQGIFILRGCVELRGAPNVSRTEIQETTPGQLEQCWKDIGEFSALNKQYYSPV